MDGLAQGLIMYFEKMYSKNTKEATNSQWSMSIDLKKNPLFLKKIFLTKIENKTED